MCNYLFYFFFFFALDPAKLCMHGSQVQNAGSCRLFHRLRSVLRYRPSAKELKDISMDYMCGDVTTLVFH